VGSPDVFFQCKAGPYPLLVTVRPADVVPGVAQIQIRSLADGLNDIQLTPTPMTGEASKHPPTADIATRSATDPKVFDGSLWLMAAGAWAVHIHASGAAGQGDMVVPVPAVAMKIAPMASGESYFLLGMMTFLVVGMVAIVGAGVRESRLEPGVPAARWTPKTFAAMGLATVLLILILWGGKVWWAADAADFQRRVYKPLQISAAVNEAGHADFKLADPGWIALRKLDDLIPDHGHMMHLFLIRWPAMDEVFHLHPDQTATGFFSQDLPSLPAGDYKVFADIVHDSGLDETAVGSVSLPEIHGKPLAGDDAGGAATADLGNGYKMVWQRDKQGPVPAKDLTLFSFAITGPDGKPVNDLEPYMGMGGHAEFVKRDGSVFAHVHPTGSASMASVAVASPAAMVAMHQTEIGQSVSFPYGVPTPGAYRIFVQLKRAGKVETGTFDLEVN
jgi:hypothetical protein